MQSGTFSVDGVSGSYFWYVRNGICFVNMWNIKFNSEYFGQQLSVNISLPEAYTYGPKSCTSVFLILDNPFSSTYRSIGDLWMYPGHLALRGFDDTGYYKAYFSDAVKEGITV